MINLQTEQEEGQTLREDEGVSGPSAARAARKQMKETAELLMEVTKDLDKE